MWWSNSAHPFRVMPTHNTHYMFGSLKGWGWISLILGIFELIAGASLLGGGTYGRWFGVLAGSLVAVESLFSIPSYPSPAEGSEAHM